MSASMMKNKLWKRSAFLTFFAHVHFVTSANSFVENKKNLFATKTAYDDAFTIKERNARELVWSHKAQNQCRPVQVNMVIRHGTRYPSAKDITRSKEIVERIKDKISKPNLQELKEWTVPFHEHEARALSPVGVKELTGLGERVASNLYELFSNAPANHILFQSSNYSRSIDSGKAFRSAFVKSKYDIPIEIRDDLLRYYDSCPKHIHEVEGSKDASIEFHKFKKGDMMKGVAKRLKSRLGLQDEDFTYGDLKAIYTSLATDLNEFGKSPWSGVWTEEDLTIMEYAADLKTFWRKGYGYSLNYEQSCPLLSNVFEHLEEAVNQQESRYKRGIFRFGHSESLVPLMSLLGLHKDDQELRANNFHEMKDRNFRASRISPFAANIAFILYKCGTDENSNESHKVKMLVNEKPTKFPFCNEELCPYNMVREKYFKYIDSCNLSTLCRLSDKFNDEL